MNRQEYREGYLQSDHWAAVREGALVRAGRRCQVCNTDRRLDVHHRTYERIGSEEPGDLTVLCRGCHDLFHSAAKPKTRARKKSVAKKPTRVANIRAVPSMSTSAHLVISAVESLPDPTATFTTADIARTTRLSKSAAGAQLGRLRTQGLLTRRKAFWRRTDADAIAAVREAA